MNLGGQRGGSSAHTSLGLQRAMFPALQQPGSWRAVPLALCCPPATSACVVSAKQTAFQRTRCFPGSFLCARKEASIVLHLLQVIYNLMRMALGGVSPKLVQKPGYPEEKHKPFIFNLRVCSRRDICLMAFSRTHLRGIQG